MDDGDTAEVNDVAEETQQEAIETPSESVDTETVDEAIQEPTEVATEDTVQPSATELHQESVVEAVIESEDRDEGAETVEEQPEGVQEPEEGDAVVTESKEGEEESGEVVKEEDGGGEERGAGEEGVEEEKVEVGEGEEGEKEEGGVGDGEEAGGKEEEGVKEEIEEEEKGEEGEEGEHGAEEVVGVEEVKEEGEKEETEETVAPQEEEIVQEAQEDQEVQEVQEVQEIQEIQEETTEPQEVIEGEVREQSDGGMQMIVEEGDDVSDVDIPQPLEFVVRPSLPADEFTLDPELDENELQFVLASPSAGSVDVGVVPVVQAVKAEIGAPSAETILVPFDRETYYENHRAQTLERTNLTRRNAVLQRKLMEHFKKRKMNDVFKETDEATPEMVAKYTKKLAIFGDLQATFEATRRQANSVIEDMMAEETKLLDELQDSVDSLVAAERETAAGLLDRKTGKAMSEKLVERLIRRQRELIKELGETRLIYIKARDKVAAKEAAIRALEDLGQNLSMLDYEQLRMENQNLTDKIEERDEEMARLRARAMHSAQALTHYKEKMCMVVGLLDKQLAMLRQKECELGVARTELNTLKVTRDRLRADFARESAQAGLLTKPQLLRDFEDTLAARDDMRAQLERLLGECAAEKEQLTAVREAVGRSAGVEVEIKPKRTTFLERVLQKGEQRGRRGKGVKKQGADAEEIFQMR